MQMKMQKVDNDEDTSAGNTFQITKWPSLQETMESMLGDSIIDSGTP